MSEKQTTQPEVIITLETMKENRKNVLDIFTFLKSKYIDGSFTINELLQDRIYNLQMARFVIDTLSRNGMLNATTNNNPNFIRYSLVGNKEKQKENISLWLKRAKQELDFFTLAIDVINDEIKQSETNLKIV